MAALAGTYADRKAAAAAERDATEQDIRRAMPEALVFETADTAIKMTATVYEREVKAAMDEFKAGMRALLGLTGESGLVGKS